MQSSVHHESSKNKLGGQPPPGAGTGSGAFSFSTEETTPVPFAFTAPSMPIPDVNSHENVSGSFGFTPDAPSSQEEHIPSPVLGLVRDNTMLPIVTGDVHEEIPLEGPLIQRNLTTMTPHGATTPSKTDIAVAKAPVLPPDDTESPITSNSTQPSQVTSPGYPGQFSAPILVRDPSSHSFQADDDVIPENMPLTPATMMRLNTSTLAHGVDFLGDVPTTTSSPNVGTQMQSPLGSSGRLGSHRGSLSGAEIHGGLSRDEGFEILNTSRVPSTFMTSPQNQLEKTPKFGFDQSQSQDMIPDLPNDKQQQPQLMRATTSTNNHVPGTYTFDMPSDGFPAFPKLGRAPTAIHGGNDVTGQAPSDLTPGTLSRTRTISADTTGATTPNSTESQHAFR